LPIRLLLVTPRPEDEACGYIDHRISAKPLVQAIANLGNKVELGLLDPPTFLNLLTELAQARQTGKPYHVVHFDGHGVYSRREGLGGLCFEDPQDQDQIYGRRHQTVYTDKIGPALLDHRIPLVFLEACQTAQADTLNQLGRHAEARTECRLALRCKEAYSHASEPWKTWEILSQIETGDGQPQAAAAARRKAVECYLAYRRDGGEHTSDSG